MKPPETTALDSQRGNLAAAVNGTSPLAQWTAMVAYAAVPLLAAGDHDLLAEIIARRGAKLYGGDPDGHAAWLPRAMAAAGLKLALAEPDDGRAA